MSKKTGRGPRRKTWIVHVLLSLGAIVMVFPFIWQLVTSFKTMATAVNEGKLVREVSRKTEVAENISALVSMLTDDPNDEDSGPSSPEPSGGFLGRLFGRG